MADLFTEQERKWIEADKEKRRKLDKPCLTCVWAHIEDDKIFCPIVGENSCWKDWRGYGSGGKR